MDDFLSYEVDEPGRLGPADSHQLARMSCMGVGTPGGEVDMLSGKAVLPLNNRVNSRLTKRGDILLALGVSCQVVMS